MNHTAVAGEPRPSILLVGHWGIPTGFSRVIQALAPRFAVRWDVHVLAVNSRSDGVSPTPGVTIHENPNPRDLHDPRVLEDLLRALRPALMLILDEPWACARLAPAISNFPEIHTVLYLAVHGSGSVTPDVWEGLRHADHLVAFTPSAADLLRAASHGDSDLRISSVPHGIDTQAFRPLVYTRGQPDFAASRQLARQILFPDEPEMQSALLVLNASRNQPFKRVDICLESFAQFAQGKPNDVFLYLHMGSGAGAPGSVSSIDYQIDRLGIRPRIRPCLLPPRHPAIPNAELNIVYNACDIGITTSQYEAWGLATMEHAATGAAQIVPRHTACAEIWNGAAITLDVDEAIFPTWMRASGGTVQIESVAHALESLYINPQMRMDLAWKAFRNATRPELQWDRIAARWNALITRELDYAAHASVKLTR